MAEILRTPEEWAEIRQQRRYDAWEERQFERQKEIARILTGKENKPEQISPQQPKKSSSEELDLARGYSPYMRYMLLGF